MEMRTVFNATEIKWFAGMEDGRVFGEVSVMWVV